MGSLPGGVSAQGGVCIGDVCPGDVCRGGGGVCLGGVCPRGCLPKEECLPRWVCPGVSAQGVFA